MVTMSYTKHDLIFYVCLPVYQFGLQGLTVSLNDCWLHFFTGAVGYYETSSLTGAGVEETIEFCVRTVLKLNTRSLWRRIR